jgi:hypothetical protein
MSASSFLYLIPLFLIPFVAFVLAPKLGPVFRKLQRYFNS